MSQVQILDKILKEGQKSLDFFLQRDFSAESPGFYDHLRTVARMAHHAFDIMEPVTRKWAELRDDEVQGKLSITAEEKDEMLDPDNIKKKISPQDNNGKQVSISSISELSQDVSFSTKTGRELPIAGQVNTEVATDGSDVYSDQSNSVVSDTSLTMSASSTDCLIGTGCQFQQSSETVEVFTSSSSERPGSSNGEISDVNTKFQNVSNTHENDVLSETESLTIIVTSIFYI